MDNEKRYNEEMHYYAININEENLNNTKLMGLFSLSIDFIRATHCSNSWHNEHWMSTYMIAFLRFYF